MNNSITILLFYVFLVDEKGNVNLNRKNAEIVLKDSVFGALPVVSPVVFKTGVTCFHRILTSLISIVLNHERIMWIHSIQEKCL